MNLLVKLLLIVTLLSVCTHNDAKPMYQVLSAKDGYIPVYIRVGDTPLDDINPALASAFHETVLGRNIGKDVAAEPEIGVSKTTIDEQRALKE